MGSGIVVEKDTLIPVAAFLIRERSFEIPASINALCVTDLSGGGVCAPPTPRGARKVGSMDRDYAMSYSAVK